MSLLNTEAELNAAVMSVQDALFVRNTLKSVRLKVKLPILARIDNSRAENTANNCSVGGKIRHVEAKQNFLQELKRRVF